MNMGHRQKNRTKTGALVLVSGDGVASRAAGKASRDPQLLHDNSADMRVTPARSAFLVQLTQQYETRLQASKRCAQARERAAQSYAKPAQKTRLRHLVWA